jgi:hypothetical protein
MTPADPSVLSCQEHHDLGFQTEVRPPARPTWESPEVLEPAKTELAKKIMAWDGLKTFEQLEAYKTDAEAALRHYNQDGYAIARMLESEKGYDPDENLVELLGGCRSHLTHTPLTKAIRNWVASHHISTNLQIGDVVEFRQKALHRDEEWIQGTITQLQLESATAYIHLPNTPKTSNRVVTWEDIRKLSND